MNTEIQKGQNEIQVKDDGTRVLEGTLGCVRHGAEVMVTVTEIAEEFKFYDLFFHRAEAENLYEQLGKILGK